MDTRSSSTNTPSRRSCRVIRSSCSKGPRRHRRWGTRLSLEPRRFDQDTDRPSPRDGSATGRAIVIEPYLRERSKSGSRALRSERSPEAKLDEAVGLAHAIDLDVASSGVVPLTEIRPATFIGKGKVE